MGIHNMIQNALGTEWTLTDDFQFTFANPSVQLDGGHLPPQDLWDICVINIDTPQLTSNVNDYVVGGSRKFSVSRFEKFTISVTFRDVLGLKLKEYFTKIWMMQQTRYPDEIQSTLTVSANQSIIFHSNKCLIDSVSQSQLDNSNTQILEFTVQFSSPIYSNSTVSEFGAPGKIAIS